MWGKLKYVDFFWKNKNDKSHEEKMQGFLTENYFINKVSIAICLFSERIFGNFRKKMVFVEKRINFEGNAQEGLFGYSLKYIIG